MSVNLLKTLFIWRRYSYHDTWGNKNEIDKSWRIYISTWIQIFITPWDNWILQFEILLYGT